MAGAGGGGAVIRQTAAQLIHHCPQRSPPGNSGDDFRRDLRGTGIKGPRLHPRGQSAFNLAGKAAGSRSQATRRQASVAWTHSPRPFSGDGQLHRRAPTLCHRGFRPPPTQILTNRLDFPRLTDKRQIQLTADSNRQGLHTGRSTA